LRNREASRSFDTVIEIDKAPGELASKGGVPIVVLPEPIKTGKAEEIGDASFAARAKGGVVVNAMVRAKN